MLLICSWAFGQSFPARHLAKVLKRQARAEDGDEDEMTDEEEDADVEGIYALFAEHVAEEFLGAFDLTEELRKKIKAMWEGSVWAFDVDEFDYEEKHNGIGLQFTKGQMMDTGAFSCIVLMDPTQVLD